MTPAHQSLRDLIAKVEALKAGKDEFVDAALYCLRDPENLTVGRNQLGGAVVNHKQGPRWGAWELPSPTSSLEAAVAFTEALLPEAKKLIREEAKDWVTTHWRAVLELPKPPYTMVGDAPTPALALVLAALRAHAAKETT